MACCENSSYFAVAFIICDELEQAVRSALKRGINDDKLIPSSACHPSYLEKKKKKKKEKENILLTA